MTTTWNPNDKHASLTLTSNNRIATKTASGETFANVRSTTSKTGGKFVFRLNGLTTSDTYDVGIGLANASASLSNYLGADNNSVGAYAYGYTQGGYNNDAVLEWGTTDEMLVGPFFAIDMEGGTIRDSFDGVTWSKLWQFPSSHITGPKFLTFAAYRQNDSWALDPNPTGWTLAGFQSWDDGITMATPLDPDTTWVNGGQFAGMSSADSDQFWVDGAPYARLTAVEGGAAISVSAAQTLATLTNAATADVDLEVEKLRNLVVDNRGYLGFNLTEVVQGVTITRTPGVDGNGEPYCDFRWQGTAVGNMYGDQFFTYATELSAAGDKFTYSMRASRVAGSFPAGVIGFISTAYNDTSFNYAGEIADLYYGDWLTSSPQDFVNTGTIPINGYVNPRIQVYIPDAIAVDVTIRVSQVQFERGFKTPLQYVPQYQVLAAPTQNSSIMMSAMPDPVAVTGAQTLTATTQSATAGPRTTATAAQNTSAPTQSATVSAPHVVRNASAAQTLSSTTQASALSVPAGISASQTAQSASQAASASVSVSESASQTTSATTQSTTTQVRVAVTGAQATSAAASSASATVDAVPARTASAAQTLSAATNASELDVRIAATVGQIMQAALQSASADLDHHVAGAQTLSAPQNASDVDARVAGTTTQTVNGATSVSLADVDVRLTGGQTLAKAEQLFLMRHARARQRAASLLPF